MVHDQIHPIQFAEIGTERKSLPVKNQGSDLIIERQSPCNACSLP